MKTETLSAEHQELTFFFRPWVRRAGLSIVLVAAAVTAVLAAAFLLSPRARYGWIGEAYVWVYLGALWAGGLRVYVGTFRPIAELGESVLVLRPLHQLRSRSIPWNRISGTEQMVPGDRLIVYFEGPRGMRFVALNLNLVRGRRDLLRELDRRLIARGFAEKLVDRSRYLSRVRPEPEGH
ncbi:MAG TPA: hypothetical protein VMS12_04595 [Thermoanaerobaculia bacterium]|nr:hypothetical protein [Thermoanaerobaculia bacterium]